jgi:hypothetical protein
MSTITEIVERVGDFQLQEAEPRSTRHVSASNRRLVAHPKVPSLTPVGDAQCAVELRRPTRARHWRPYLAVAGLFWAVPAGLLLVGYLALPDITSSQCQGSGFGCGLTPKGWTVVLAIYVYPFVVVAGWLVMAVIAMGRAWRHMSRWLTRKVTARRCSSASPAQAEGSFSGDGKLRGPHQQQRSLIGYPVVFVHRPPSR